MLGLAYGLRKEPIPFKAIVTIFLGSAFSMILAMELGKVLSGVLNEHIEMWLSVILLTGLGIRIIWENCRSKPEEPPYATLPQEQAATFNLLDAWFMGMVLGMDDNVEAVGLAMIGFPVALTVVIFKVMAFFAFCTGIVIGNFGYSKLPLRRLEILPGIILILLGIKQLL
jgi:putative Mn2+ efflux pump MntP